MFRSLYTSILRVHNVYVVVSKAWEDLACSIHLPIATFVPYYMSTRAPRLMILFIAWAGVRSELRTEKGNEQNCAPMIYFKNRAEISQNVQSSFFSCGAAIREKGVCTNIKTDVCVCLLDINYPRLYFLQIHPVWS